MCRYYQISTGAKVDLSTINNKDQGRDRGLEVLLYKPKEDTQNEPVSYKFDLKKMFSFFNREFHFQIKLIIKKNNSREAKKC